MEFDIRPYDLAGGAASWLTMSGILLAAGVVIAILLSLARNGVSGLAVFSRGLAGYFSDLLTISPRRIYALTRLTLLEAVRRKALLVFVVFAILLMFAGWFLADSNERPELQVSVHVTFLLTAISWLILPAVIFLSCWALPEDIRIRSLHTVVTKPARRVEIVAGRIAGMSVVALLVLAIMGVVGYFWINRQLPERAREMLTCRVPVFGELYFFDQNGQPSDKGINVGDVWMYRSHITGNSRARAIWMFPGVDENALVTGTIGDGDDVREVDGLKLECRFEAFRTVKGSEKSVLQGVQAQYTLSSNPREEAFGMIAQGEALRPLADALRDGQFRTASERMKELATQVRSASDELRPVDYAGLQNGLRVAGDVLAIHQGESIQAVSKLFQEAGRNGLDVMLALRNNSGSGSSVEVPYAAFADTLETTADGLSEHADALHEGLPRLEVPLPSFHISEYNEGAAENISFIPRRLRFPADYETQARFLAGLISEWNDSGRLLDGDRIRASLADDISSSTGLSPLNAEPLAEILQEQLQEGRLLVNAGKLEVADGRRWFTYFDELIRREQLISRDPDGWVIEKDLIDDMTMNGYLRVEVACLNDQMYLGMARPDLFIRKPDSSFLAGYSKALLNIALMLMLIIVLGVTVSCVVKGPVALFFTLTFFVVGQFFHEFMLRMLSGQEQGTGTFESAVLIAQHRNPQVGMDISEATSAVIRGADKGLEGILRLFSSIVPDFSVFNRGAVFVENGFDVPFRECVLPALAIFFGFLVPCILIAGALLKFRELEAK